MPDERPPSCSNIGLESQHVFISGAAGAIGGQVIQVLLGKGCHVTAYDSRPVQLSVIDAERYSRLQILSGDPTDEQSVQSAFAQAQKRFGPATILVVNSGPDRRIFESPIWEQSLKEWETESTAGSRATFLATKHFLRCFQEASKVPGHETTSPAIVVAEAESESSIAHCKAGLHHGLLERVQDEISKIHPRGRINVVAFDNSHIENGALTPDDIAREISLLASGLFYYVSGRYTRIEPGNNAGPSSDHEDLARASSKSIPRALTKPQRNKIRVAVSIDLDAVSGWLGTNSHPDNVLADYSAGFFAARVGVPRLLRMLKKLDIADRCTWFIPGHSAESFPEEVKQVVESGCEIGLHGYAHEGAYQLTPEQERDVLIRCMEISKNLTGKTPMGYRAPLYQLRESTLDLLEEFGFEYDASLTDHDCHPFFAPRRVPLEPIDFSKPASTWMHPVKESPSPPDRRPLVCVPCNYYMEDMTPMQFLPHTENSHGYVDVRVIENLWRDRFTWIRDNEEDPVFPVLMHPDTSGMAHVIGMLERMLQWLKGWEEEGEVEFMQTGEIARWWREKMSDGKT